MLLIACGVFGREGLWCVVIAWWREGNVKFLVSSIWVRHASVSGVVWGA
jgi:hypothetical protein